MIRSIVFLNWTPIKTSFWNLKDYYPKEKTKQRVKSNSGSEAYHDCWDSVTILSKVGHFGVARG